MNNDPQLVSRVQHVIEDTFKVPPGSNQSYAMGAVPGWDSLGHMRLVIELESVFGVTFPTYTLSELTSVPAIVKALKDLN
jgi:acyl carrier protein